MIMYRYVPYIPILGIPLTFYFHLKYGDTVIAPTFGKHFWLSMFSQVFSGLVLLSL